jgi:lipoprotein-releasing system permease protein
MRLSIVPFLALRYLGARRRGSAPALLSVLGVGVGVMTLTVVLGVMNGFQLGFIEAIIEISSYHLQVHEPRGGPYLPPETVSRIRSIPGVKTVVPFAEEQGLAEGPSGRPRPCVLRAVPADLPSQDPVQGRMLSLQSGSFALGDPGSIVIGSELAGAIGARIGDKFAFSYVDSSSGSPHPRNAAFTVRGIFRCGYYDFDSSLAFISLEALARVSAGRQPLSYGVKIADRFADAGALAAVSALVSPHGSQAASWRSYNRAFFDALLMEKLMMMALVGLIFIVVGFNIFHSLRRTIREKMEEIAVLKAVGVPPRAIQYAFICEGAVIGAAGAFSGMLLGLLLAGNVNTLFAVVERTVNMLTWLAGSAAAFAGGGARGSFAVFSPLYFYLTEVPSRVLFPEALAVASFALLSCLVAAYGASRTVAAFRPSEVLRYE